MENDGDDEEKEERPKPDTFYHTSNTIEENKKKQ